MTTPMVETGDLERATFAMRGAIAVLKGRPVTVPSKDLTLVLDALAEARRERDSALAEAEMFGNQSDAFMDGMMKLTAQRDAAIRELGAVARRLGKTEAERDALAALLREAVEAGAGAKVLLSRLRVRNKTEFFVPGSVAPELLRRSEETLDELLGCIVRIEAALAPYQTLSNPEPSK